MSRKKLIKGIGTLILLSALEGCASHKNPMLNQDSIDALKNYYEFTADSSVGICPKYWADFNVPAITQSTKNLCDQQMQKDYKYLNQNRQDILQSATFADYSDASVWKMYLGISR